MEKAIEIIKNRIQRLEREQNIQYLGDDYYNELEVKISELESLLDELQMENNNNF